MNSLAVERNVSVAPQNQALSAWLFLYRELLGIGLPWLGQHRNCASLLSRRAGVVGYSAVSTTMIYTHDLNRGGRGGWKAHSTVFDPN